MTTILSSKVSVYPIGHKELNLSGCVLPVPLSKGLRVLGTAIVDPIGNERADRIEHLPEGHDLAADLDWSQLADVDGASSQSQALPDTDERTACNELAAGYQYG